LYWFCIKNAIVQNIGNVLLSSVCSLYVPITFVIRLSTDLHKIVRKSVFLRDITANQITIEHGNIIELFLIRRRFVIHLLADLAKIKSCCADCHNRSCL